MRSFWILFFFLFALISPTCCHAKKIAVIGGGLSGLTVAHRLYQHGCDVEVFEARDRVGGRVFSAYLDGQIIELGAKNLNDGGEAKHLIALIEEFGLPTRKDLFVRKTNFYDGTKLINLSEAISEITTDLNELRNRLDQAASHAHNMADVLDNLFAHHTTLLQYHRTLLSAYEGGPVDQLSLYYIETLYHMILGGLSALHPGSEEEITYIDYLDIEGGNSLLPQKMAEQLGSRVHLGSPLKSIVKNTNGQYLLEFQNGKHSLADIIVLTIPCSVYRDIDIDATVIPIERLEGIQAIRYGTNSKIIISLPTISKKAETVSNERMVAIRNEDRATTLTLYFVGYNGDFDASSINAVIAKDLPFLSAVYGVDAIPPASVATDILYASYDGAVGHSWLKDPYIKGSYSFISPGQENLTSTETYRGELVRTLFSPINDSVFFAGEHTTVDFRLGGTVEAAVESGERIARLVLNQISENNISTYSHLYFGYGSNLSREFFNERLKDGEWLEDGWHKSGTIIDTPPLDLGAYVLDNYEFGYTLDLKTETTGNIVPKKDSKVYGVLYGITERQLQELDRTEDVPRDYQRVALDVNRVAINTFNKNLPTATAWVYVGNPSLVTNQINPDPTYVKLLVTSAADRGFPKEYIENRLSAKAPALQH